jgi:hypothetical protein
MSRSRGGLVLDSTPPRRRRAVSTDGVALGAYRQLRTGPRGVSELGLAFLAVHDRDLLAVIGQLVLRVDILERRFHDCQCGGTS